MTSLAATRLVGTSQPIQDVSLVMALARMTLGSAVIAGGALLLFVQPATATVQKQAGTAAQGFETSRTFQLPAGRASRTFTLREGRGVILVNRLTVRRGVRVTAYASIPHLAGAGVISWPNQHGGNTSLSCRRKGSHEVCNQAEEWCPMPKATWHVRLVKLSGPAGAVRFDYVVAPAPPQG
jgi:hypothetical protein